jgi:hypothetical protein
MTLFNNKTIKITRKNKKLNKNHQMMKILNYRCKKLLDLLLLIVRKEKIILILPLRVFLLLRITEENTDNI